MILRKAALPGVSLGSLVARFGQGLFEFLDVGDKLEKARGERLGLPCRHGGAPAGLPVLGFALQFGDVFWGHAISTIDLTGNFTVRFHERPRR